MSKPVLVHVIDDLGRGGAEILLVDLLPALAEHYDVVLVTLTANTEFPEGSVKCAHRYILNYRGKRDIFKAAGRLKKIITKHKPVLVRSQLFWSSLIARIGCPKSVPLVFSIHTKLSDASFNGSLKGKVQQRIERTVYKKRHTLIAVSAEALDDYNKSIGIKGASYVLHNYVNDVYFHQTYTYTFTPGKPLRLVAVGNPKREKNYEFLVSAFQLLQNMPVICDIYGGGFGKYDEQLQQLITEKKVPITLKGKSSSIAVKLKEYDAFIMPSSIEGFGIAAAEAMAVGLPVFLSDIKVFHEVSHDSAIFFDLANPQALADKIIQFIKGGINGEMIAEAGKKIALDHYLKATYVQKLLWIYESCIARN